MPQRSYRENQRLHKPRRRRQADKRRRDLLRKDPDLKPRQVANVGDGLTGCAGLRALMAWLKSVEDVLPLACT